MDSSWNVSENFKKYCNSITIYCRSIIGTIEKENSLILIRILNYILKNLAFHRDHYFQGNLNWIWILYYGCNWRENKKNQLQLVIILGIGMTTWPALTFSNSWSITCQGRKLKPSNRDWSIRFSLTYSIFSGSSIPPEKWLYPPTMMMPIPSGDITMDWLISPILWGRSGPVNVKKLYWFSLLGPADVQLSKVFQVKETELEFISFPIHYFQSTYLIFS